MRYVKKKFLSPKAPDQGGAILAQVEFDKPEYEPKRYSGSLESHLEVRDCTTRINLEFFISSCDMTNQKSIDRTRRQINYRRKKIKKLIKTIRQFADAYEQALVLLEGRLDEGEKRLEKIELLREKVEERKVPRVHHLTRGG